MPSTPWQRVAQGFWVVVGLSFISFPAIVVVALGVSLLLFVGRLVPEAIFAFVAAGAFIFAQSRRIVTSARPV